jgi:hypothetical protein
MIDEHFVILGAIIGFLGGLVYLAATLKGTVQPNRVSWFLWCLAPLVAFAAEVQQGVGLPALLSFVAGFNPLLVLVASFASRKSAWQVTRFDLCCGALSLAGLGLWYVTRIGNVAIVFAILADGLAAVPTLVKAYRAPESESWVPFLAFSASAAITLLTISSWNFATYGFPVYLLGIGLVLTSLIKFRLGRLVNPNFASRSLRPSGDEATTTDEALPQGDFRSSPRR